MKQWIFGHHAVQATLEAGKRSIFDVYMNEKMVEKYKPLLKGIKTNIHVLTPKEMDQKFSGKVHQGIALRASELPESTLDDVLPDAQFLLILDQITDPQNLGACLRSANAFGCDAVLTPHHGSASMGDVAAKASVGASEITPVIEVPNLNKAIEKLKAEDFWIVGLDGYAKQELSQVDLKGKIAIVMGNEGKGLRQLVKKNCDFTAKLPMVGSVESLNVSVATGVALYEALKQRQ